METSAPIFWKAKRWLVRIYYAYCLASMTGYYFSVVDRFGDNSAFVLGVLMASLIFRLPPREFLILLGLNQAVFLAGAFQTNLGRDYLLSALIFSTDALILGCLGAWTLFASDWRNFQQKRALERANLELLRQDEEKNELMAITAHELASPLDSMKMLYRLLLQDPAWNQQPYREVLESSKESLGAMQALVARLLEAHAVESHGASAIMAPIDLAAIIDRALATVSPAAEAKSIRLACTPFASKPCVLADSFLAEQAIENLLYNAVKFSQPGTTVELRTHRESGFVIVDVIDEGPGIREEDRIHLFRKFHKTTNKPTNDEPSFGVGLFIVSKLMQIQKGSVSHIPREPRGSVFRLQLAQAENAGDNQPSSLR